ncbi:tetratricopeptide repeat protein [Phenylobacterium hankyongense]|nr:tetratricopeptide repeat protein [Phenylobacterium hankyongense]
MDERLAAAQQALQAGRTQEGIGHLVALLESNPQQPLAIYAGLAVQLHRAGRFVDVEAWTAKGVALYPRSLDLWNTRGVALRRLGRLDEAVAALTTALRLQPKSTAALSNLANTHLDREDGAAAEGLLTKLLRLEPKNAEYQRLLGRALLKQGRSDAALARFRQAVMLDRNAINAWLDLSGTLSDLHRHDEANEVLSRARQAHPNDARLIEGVAILLRREGRNQEAEDYLLSQLPAHEGEGWIHRQLGAAFADADRRRANQHLRRAVELEPANRDYVFALAESLQRSRYDDEAAHIEESYQVVRRLIGNGALTPRHEKVASEIFLRVGAYDELDRLGRALTLGRRWAEAGMHAALMNQPPRVRSPEDRRELVELHRIWGRGAEADAALRPITRPPARTPRAKLRIGFMSSDLRSHPVGYFALPLVEAYDRSRFEVYCYSFNRGEADPMQRHIESLVDAFRWRPAIGDHDAAQMIADDDLDILIELGGSTHMNKLNVMSYKPAPIAASWLGYAHSAGPSTIDYLILDPYMTPAAPELLIEKPLMLPHCWYSLAREAFRPEPAVEPIAPVERNGFVTFGTANNPYKYGREMLAAWARIVARTPGSRFMFIRPECGSPTFRANMAAAFAAEGVAPERLLFESIRGRHLPFYNQIDMSLDTFPQTGGTTTCESLWMGAPVITLVGEALYERLSYSVLMNLGLEEFCTTTVQAYEDAAVALAADPARIGQLRRSLRDRMRASPLGDSNAWAADFFDAVAGAVEPSR